MVFQIKHRCNNKIEKQATKSCLTSDGRTLTQVKRISDHEPFSVIVNTKSFLIKLYILKDNMNLNI